MRFVHHATTDDFKTLCDFRCCLIDLLEAVERLRLAREEWFSPETGVKTGHLKRCSCTYCYLLVYMNLHNITEPDSQVPWNLTLIDRLIPLS